jgi:glycosyl transferase family 1
MVEHVYLIYRNRNRPVDGIRDHGQRLADHLSQRSIEVYVGPTLTAGGVKEVRAWMSLWNRLRGSGEGSAVVIQYNPFAYGRWGFAPWLPLALFALRCMRDTPSIAVMVHEPYVPMVSWRSTLMGSWQRFQLAALRLSADVIFTSVESWASRFESGRPRRRAHHLPVGSNLPDRRGSRMLERERCGLDNGTLAVAVIGRHHDTWLGGYVVDAVNTIAAAGNQVALLLLGAEAPQLADLDPRVEVQMAGYLEETELSAKLSAADLFLAPLSDGVTTKRSTVMAALQHGLPVVATEGPLTDSVLRTSDSGISLTPVGARGDFAAAALLLAEDNQGRAEQAAAARELYEDEFDWPVVSERMLAAL